MRTALRTLLVAPLLAVGASACVGLLGDFSVSSSANDGGPGDDAATIEASSEASSEGSAPEGGGGEAGEADFSLTVATPYVGVVRGATGTVGVTLAPSGGFAGAVAITVSGLPSGITADPLTIAAGQTSGTLTLHAPAGATLGDGPQLTVTGTSGALTHTATLGLLVQDAAGTLDSTFGNQGLVNDNSMAFRSFGAMALQTDGKILVCGTIDEGPWVAFVRRFNADGTPDPSFGTSVNGGPPMATIPSPTPGTNATCDSLVELPSGDIALTGSAEDSRPAQIPWVVELKSDGSLNQTFGSMGIAQIPLESNFSVATGIVVDTNGNLVIAGSSWNSRPLLARLAPSGVLDTTFAGGGPGYAQETYQSASGFDRLTLAPNGGILIPLAFSTLAVQRYTPAGILDSTFYAQGTATASLGVGASTAKSAAVANDGSVVLSGSGVASMNDGSSTSEIALARFKSTGQADPMFGTGGTVGAALGAGNSWANDGEIDASGRIVVAGHIESDPQHAFGIARFASSGALDATFASGQGYVSTAVGSNSEAFSVAVLPDGIILVAGATGAFGSHACRIGADGGVLPCNWETLLLARYWP